MKNPMKLEPALILGLAQAALVVAVSFGFNLSAEQVTALAGLAAAITAVLTRQNVYSPQSAEAIAKTATDPPPSRDEAAKAAMALGVPVELAEKAATLALGGLLPANWISLIVTTAAGVDYSRLAKEVEKALSRRPTTEELLERSKTDV